MTNRIDFHLEYNDEQVRICLRDRDDGHWFFYRCRSFREWIDQVQETPPFDEETMEVVHERIEEIVTNLETDE